MDHTATIATLADALRDIPEIQALFLSGSYATGHADAYSDIDFVVVAADGASERLSEIWKQAVSQTGDILLWRDRAVSAALINAIRSDWTRIDVVILKPAQLQAQTQDRLSVLFDHGDLYAGLPPQAPKPQQDPAHFTYQVEEFIRIFGLLHLVAGRQEYNNGVLGVFHLRNLLVDLMIAETAEPVRGGVLHLKRLISPEQDALLTGLPAPVAHRDQIIACHLAYANAYLPRAKRMAREIGATWPVAFEQATGAMLRDKLGITRDEGGQFLAQKLNTNSQ